MLWQANPYSAPLFGAAVTGLAILLLASRRHQAPGAPALAALGLGIAIWCAAYGLVWGASAPAVGQLAHRAATLGSTIVPAAFLYFTVRIGRRVVRWLGQLRAGLLGLGALQILIAWSNPFSLWYAAEAMQTVSGLPIATFQPGPAYWLFNVVYSYGLILSGTVVLGLEFWNARGIYRAQYGWTLVGVALSFAASVVTELGLTPWPGLDLAPISMALSGLLFTYALFRYRLLDLVPVARTTLVDNMPDALIALDPQQRVVDINPAALRLLGWAGPLPLGQPWERVCAVWPDLAGRYAAVYETQAEEQPALGLTLDLRITPLPDPAGEARGRLIVLRDITDLKRTEQELQTANRQLRDQLAQIRDLQDQLREQAVRDPLTGLYNRRYLEETLPREAARAAREREPLSLIFIDIDRFKGVNDVFGHAAGDRVLQALGTFLVSHTRGGDIVCRYGGEELVVVLPNAATEVARRRAEEWRQGIAQLQVLSEAGRPIQVTISSGLAAFPLHGAAIDEVLRAADKALYAAKAAGRNCVVTAPSRPAA